MPRLKLATTNGVILDNFSSGSGSGSSVTISYTVGLDDGILILCTGAQDSNDANLPITTATYNGVALTKLRSDTNNNDIRSEIWYLVDPPVGTYNLVFGTGTGVWKAGIVSSWGNVPIVSTTDTSAGGSGNSSSPSASITPTYEYTLLISSLCSKSARTALGSTQASLGTVQGQSFQNLSASYIVTGGTIATAVSASLSSGADWNVSLGTFKSETPIDGERTAVTGGRTALVRSKLTVGQ